MCEHGTNAIHYHKGEVVYFKDGTGGLLAIIKAIGLGTMILGDVELDGVYYPVELPTRWTLWREGVGVYLPTDAYLVPEGDTRWRITEPGEINSEGLIQRVPLPEEVYWPGPKMVL